jgi:hypothetical protein
VNGPRRVTVRRERVGLSAAACLVAFFDQKWSCLRFSESWDKRRETEKEITRMGECEIVVVVVPHRWGTVGGGVGAFGKPRVK